MSSGGTPPVAMSIAGSDSGSGAGIQADLRTMAAFGVLATTALTAVTAQNTTEVRGVHVVPPEMVEAQIDAVLADLPVAATKTGLLAAAPTVEVVATRARAGALPRLVVDPVMVASTGRPLLDAAALDAYRRALLPHALVVTPNLWEAAMLAGAGSPPTDVAGMVEMARRVHDLGPAWVLVKGGHLPGVGDGGPPPSEVVDVLFDGRDVERLTTPPVETRNTHGTGCSLSAAVAAGLAQSGDVPEAVRSATRFVHDALVGSRDWRLGGGHGPIDHLGWSTST